MPNTPRRRSTASRSLPTTIWFTGPDESNAAPIPGAALPAWVIDKVSSKFVGPLVHPPAPLVKIAIRDTAPGTDARIPSIPFTGTAGDDRATGRPSILLAELRPSAVPAISVVPHQVATRAMEILIPDRSRYDCPLQGERP